MERRASEAWPDSVAIDMIYDIVEQHLQTGRFARLDTIISGIAPGRLSVDALLAVLTATLPASSRLPARRAFYQKTEAVLASRGESTRELLAGLVG